MLCKEVLKQAIRWSSVGSSGKNWAEAEQSLRVSDGSMVMGIDLLRPEGFTTGTEGQFLRKQEAVQDYDDLQPYLLPALHTVILPRPAQH